MALGENCVWSLRFLFITESFSLVTSGILVKLLFKERHFVWQFENHCRLTAIPECLGISWSKMFFSNSNNITFTWCINHILFLNTFLFFLFRRFYKSTRFLSLLKLQSSVLMFLLAYKSWLRSSSKIA